MSGGAPLRMSVLEVHLFLVSLAKFTLVKIMREIILHIGMHKTGSSSIQRAITGYDDGVTKYADLEYENHSIPFYTVFSGRQQNYHIWKSAGLSAEAIEHKKLEYLKLIERSLKDDSRRRIVFSGEDISIIPHLGIVELGRMLRKYSDRILVIGYFRDPASYIESSWQEDIKNGSNRMALHGPAYRSRFEKFIRFFGADNIMLRHFKKEKLINGDVVSDFSSAAGLSLVESSTVVNISLSTEAVKCVYILNTLIEPSDGDQRLNEARRVFINTLSELLPGPFCVPVEFVNSAINDSDCEWLENFTGVTLEKGDRGRERGTLYEGFDLFFQELSNDTIDILLKHLNSAADFNRNPKKIVHRLYLECFESRWRRQLSFSAERYLALNPDVKAAGVDPYRHYLTFGIKEGRRC
jgi:hypothetical protein